MRGSDLTHSLVIRAQTEDQFTTLTPVVRALLAFYERDVAPDEIAAKTGDCFALRMDPEKRSFGMVGASDHLLEGLADLGLRVRLVAERLTEDDRLRVSTIIVAGVRNLRGTLVCGGWPPLRARERDYFWGIVSGYHPMRGDLLGSTVRDLLIDRMLAQELNWPDADGEAGAVCLIEGWEAPKRRPSRLAKRALERGLSILSGGDGYGGLAQYAEILHWLRTARIPVLPQGERMYPFPLLVAIRCQFETMARYLRLISPLVPGRKQGTHKRVLRIVQATSRLLIDGEPERLHARTSRPEIESATYPWAPDAWGAAAEALIEPSSPARQAEIAKIEELRDRHAELIEALDALVTN